ncbi:hypothetical protein DLREEDagr8_29690 [Dongia sp. agr-C8]
MSREREKGEKVLVRIPTEHPVVSQDLQAALDHHLQAYDVVFAIDTNTPKELLFDRRISVACVAQCKKINSDATLFRALGFFEFHNVPDKAENLGWYALQHAAVAGPDHTPEAKYAIITDSDLGLHVEYNERTKPYIGQALLKPGFTLLYATDKGQSVMNAAIAYCDKGASSYIRALTTAEMVHSAPAADTNKVPYSHARFTPNSAPEDHDGPWFRLGTARVHYRLD